MSKKHEFIFAQGYWIGQGKVTFSASPEKLNFYTRWLVDDEKQKTIKCSQQVEMQGSDERVSNSLNFSLLTETSFEVELENELVGKVKGTGVIDEVTIAWEFRGHPGFEGFEVYQLQENGDYLLHAEYASPDLFRTIIDGRIWKKTSQEQVEKQE